MNEEMSVDIVNSNIENCAATISVHLSNHGWDGGSRLVINYKFHDSEYDQDDPNDEKFKAGKNYNILICEKKELEDLRDCISKALEIWPIIILGNN